MGLRYRNGIGGYPIAFPRQKSICFCVWKWYNSQNSPTYASASAQWRQATASGFETYLQDRSRNLRNPSKFPKNHENMKFSKFQNISGNCRFFFSKNIFDKKNNMFLWFFLKSSKSYQVPCSHEFSASNSIYKNIKTQGKKKLTKN